MTVKLADKIAELLETLDIRHVFGIIGAGNVHIFEAIANRGFSELICVHHEQAATMAMQTYYRMHGRMPAALLTTGGGATNGVTGVVSAWADSVPSLIIAGNENSKFTHETNPLRMWGVQGYDTVDMVRKVTKHAVRVTDPTKVIAELHNAYDIAISGRGGPVWVEIPMNVQSAMVDETTFIPYAPTPEVVNKPKRDAGQLASAIEQLRTAKRPLLWLGYGVRAAGAESKIVALLDKLGVPALLSWAGADMVDSAHPLVAGRAGVYGQRSANFILQNCDYLLAIGTRMAIPQVGYDISEFAREARVDVVDIDPHEAKKLGARVTQAIVADAGDFIDGLLADAAPAGDHAAWVAQCDSYKKRYPWIGPEHADKGGFINSYPFMQVLANYMKDDQVIVTDMGTALLCAHQALPLKQGQRLITSTGLGEMGYGLPGAIGASFADDRGEIVCLNCDGGMMMNLQELQTMVHHELPIKLFIFNNDGYLMIKHTQNALFGKQYVGTDKKSGVSCPDFSKLATAFDMPSYQIRTWDDAHAMLPKVMAHQGPVICEVFMHPEQLFVPKLAMSAALDGTLVSPPLEDLAPPLTLAEMEEAMVIGVHPKSRSIRQ
jgi:acetolactate synthase-1/2/3 large subunit